MTTTPHAIPPQDMPRWMRQARQQINWGLPLVILLALLAMWSFTAQPGLPRTNANENFVFMARNYADALLEGRLYPRWFAHVSGGYGAPIPNFYPPGAPYLAGVVQVLFTNDPVSAVRVVYLLAAVLGSAMVYLLVARRSDAATGVLASALLILSPYIGLIAPHVLGDLPGELGLALLAGLLWSTNRLLQIGHPTDPVLLGLFTAGLLLTDLRMALAGLVLTISFVIAHVTGERTRPPLLGLLGGSLLGAAAAAVFWMPALLEQSSIHWQPSAYPTQEMLEISRVFTPVRQLDAASLRPPAQYTLGWLHPAFALAALPSSLLLRKSGGFFLLFLLNAGLLTAVGLLLFPTETWLLAPSSLCLAVAGAGVLIPRARLPERGKRLLLPLLLIGLWVFSSPIWLLPQQQSTFGSVDPLTEIRYEQLGYGIASLPPGWPLPTTLPANAEIGGMLVNGYQANNLNRIETGQTRGTEITVLAVNSHSARYQICVNPPITLDYLITYHPGWHASIATSALPVRLNPVTGLTIIEIPAGIDPALPGTDQRTQRDCNLIAEMVVWLGSTPAQTAGTAVSLLGLLALFLWRRVRLRRWDAERYTGEIALMPPAELRLLAALIALISGFVVLFTAPTTPVSLRLPAGYGLENSIAISGTLEQRVVTSVGLEPLAYRLERTNYQAGETLEFALYWRALRLLPANYRVEVYLEDMLQGARWLRSTPAHPGGYPTRRWTTETYMEDVHRIELSPTIAPGSYWITIQVYACGLVCQPDDGTLTFFEDVGMQIGTALRLPTQVRIDRAEN